MSARDKLVIGLLLVSSFVVILNETIMGVALPRLVEDLGITYSTGQWLTTAFMLTMAIVIPITGFLIQRINTRPIFILAMSLFATGTLVAAIAPGFEMLLVGRIVQASGTAIMMPLLMTTVLTLVPPATRGRTMGLISIVMSVAPAIGPTISGIILEALNWRWMFGIVLPIAVAALVVGILRIPNVTEPKKVPIDILSVVLSALAFGGIVFGLSSFGEAAEAAGAGMPPWVPLVVGAVAMAAFIWRQVSLQKKDRALLDLRTFRSRTFTVSLILLAVMMMAMFGTLIILPIYLQSVLGLKSIEVGLLLLPGGLAMGLLGPVVGRAYDRIGARPLVIPGVVILAAVFWGFSFTTAATPVWMLLALHIVMSIGLGLVFTPVFTSGLGSLKPELYSHGSATVSTIQQVAGAAGTALFVSILSTQTAKSLAEGSAQVAATEAGVHAVFVVGAIVATAAIIPALFVRSEKA